MFKKGCLQIYCGDGKGKTTASVGLAVRAVGTGLKVLFCQVMKDGTSGEIKMLQKLEITYLCCPEHYGFFWNMSDEQKEKKHQQSYYGIIPKKHGIWPVKEGYDLLVIDEFMSAYNHGLIEQKQALECLMKRPDCLEVVLTGRNPGEELLKLADYVTEMKKIKHPFDQGIPARKGIEL